MAHAPLQHPYPHQPHINRWLCQSRVLVKCTFGHLKGCWHMLITCLKFTEPNIPWVNTAACMLHIFEAQGQLFHEAWMEEAW